MIITRFSNFIHQYLSLGKAFFYPAQYGCKHCGYRGRLHRHGYYSRNVITVFGTFRIQILRVKCPCCKKTHSLLPHFLIPYFQYSFYTIFLLLFQNYVLGFSYSRILSDIKKYNSLCCLNPSSLCRFCKRFNCNFSKIKYFLLNYSDIYPQEDDNNSAVIIRSIIIFEKNFLSFNSACFMSMPSYFFSPN